MRSMVEGEQPSKTYVRNLNAGASVSIWSLFLWFSSSCFVCSLYKKGSYSAQGCYLFKRTALAMDLGRKSCNRRLGWLWTSGTRTHRVLTMMLMSLLTAALLKPLLASDDAGFAYAGGSVVSSGATEYPVVYLPSVQKKVTPRQGVYELTTETFNSFVHQESSVLVLFYAPWCFWCQMVFPQFEEASQLLLAQNVPVKLAQIDATVHRKILEAYDISGYPSFILFLDGVPHEFTAKSRMSNAIVQWLKRHLQTEVTVTAPDELKAFMASHSKEPILLGRFALDPDEQLRQRKVFIQVSRHVENAGFAEIGDPLSLKEQLEKLGVYDALSQKGAVVLIKPLSERDRVFEEPVVRYTGDISDKAQLEAFVTRNLLPTVMTLDKDTAYKALRSEKLIWALLTQKDAKASEKVERWFNATYHLAMRRKGTMVFVHLEDDNPVHPRLKELLSVPKEETLTVRVFNGSAIIRRENLLSPVVKYRPPDEALDTGNLDALSRYVDVCIAGAAIPYVRSAPLPDADEATGPIYPLVASQFDQYVYDSKFDVLLDVYAPWCGHCRQLEAVYREVALRLQRYDHIRLMKLDATENDIDLLLVGYPTIVLFKTLPNNETVIDNTGKHRHKVARYYRGERTVPAIIQWLSQMSSQPIHVATVLAGAAPVWYPKAFEASSALPIGLADEF